ncbi:hypothetical protein BWQ96_03013 [Gracilariopsis chorda]|uniref:Uncharacterized protein n=1 Tax=Gracilariopsis chorda TaxID=448386 RepID=A0A2V3IYL1_9FLOR|nr:hypothetical protein BWQ96_03013 [Gracilariopsis chorda]|eukprot:PXF47238.1 hypothetical protein BWQ96_03013 [Gracilariopsis chorda]
MAFETDTWGEKACENESLEEATGCARSSQQWQNDSCYLVSGESDDGSSAGCEKGDVVGLVFGRYELAIFAAGMGFLSDEGKDSAAVKTVDLNNSCEEKLGNQNGKSATRAFLGQVTAPSVAAALEEEIAPDFSVAALPLAKSNAVNKIPLIQCVSSQTEIMLRGKEGVFDDSFFQ